LILVVNNVNGEFGAIVSDEKTTSKPLEYELRFDIEGLFDEQSNGWNGNVCEIPFGLRLILVVVGPRYLHVNAQELLGIRLPSLG